MPTWNPHGEIMVKQIDYDALVHRATYAETKRDALMASVVILQKKLDDANATILAPNAKLATSPATAKTSVAPAPAPTVKA